MLGRICVLSFSGTSSMRSNHLPSRAITRHDVIPLVYVRPGSSALTSMISALPAHIAWGVISADVHCMGVISTDVNCMDVISTDVDGIMYEHDCTCTCTPCLTLGDNRNCTKAAHGYFAQTCLQYQHYDRQVRARVPS